MRVNSVSGSSFGSGLDTREVLERFANADDRELKYAARREASLVLNEKKHKKINNLLYWSLPVAGGLAAVASNPAKAVAAEAGKVLSPAMRNLGTFGKTALAWAGTFAFIDLLFAGRNKLAQNSEKVRNFDREHPVLSTVATIGAGIGAVILGGKGLKKLAPAISKLAQPLMNSKPAKAVGDFITKLDGKLAGSKILAKVSDGIKAMPSAIKSVAKGALEFSPLMLVFANLSHSLSFANAKRTETVRAYNELKTAQAQTREMLNSLKPDEKLPEADIF